MKNFIILISLMVIGSELPKAEAYTYLNIDNANWVRVYPELGQIPKSMDVRPVFSERYYPNGKEIKNRQPKVLGYQWHLTFNECLRYADLQFPRARHSFIKQCVDNAY